MVNSEAGRTDSVKFAAGCRGCLKRVAHTCRDVLALYLAVECTARTLLPLSRPSGAGLLRQDELAGQAEILSGHARSCPEWSQIAKL
jgi:hypothetical protein